MQYSIGAVDVVAAAVLDSVVAAEAVKWHEERHELDPVAGTARRVLLKKQQLLLQAVERTTYYSDAVV